MGLGAILRSAYAKPLLHALCLLPFAALLWGIAADSLGANPVDTLTSETGQWALRLLLATLAMSPLRQWTGQAAFIHFRRMLGLYAFFYVCCHFSIWLVFDHSVDLGAMLEDIVDRPYITLGFSALLLLVPLAVTSNQAAIRRLGRRWRTLHQLVYLIVVLAILHFIWLVKADYLEPGIYAIIAILLLLHRIGPVKRLTSRFAAAVR